MKVLIVGASIGGLIAASVYRSKGYQVTIVEKGNKVNGLYQSIETNFGPQELGMHVLYVNHEIKNILFDIFGSECFKTLKGIYVDIGSSFYKGKLYEKSCYPVFEKKRSKLHVIYNLLFEYFSKNCESESADKFFRKKFGDSLTNQFYDPVLTSLWGSPLKDLTKGCSNSYFDLRRACLFGETISSFIKKFSKFDNHIANPNQFNPSTSVFENREALIFNQQTQNDLQDYVMKWLIKNKINLNLNTPLSLKKNGQILINNHEVKNQYNKILVTAPLSQFSLTKKSLDVREMSIAYFKFRKPIMPNSNCYYTLCHEPTFACSRIVNYFGYKSLVSDFKDYIACVEVLHNPKERPSLEKLKNELNNIYCQEPLENSFYLPKSILLAQPTIKNKNMLDKEEDLIKNYYNDISICFSAMRTDRGHFFSHQTINKAYEFALEN